MTAPILPHATEPTTPIGLGCAYLAGGFEKAKNVRLVQAAYEAGIRHFDVAPLYGMGMAEDVLGEALNRRRSTVTVATKAGIARPEVNNFVLLGRAIALPLRRLVPSVTRKLGAKIVGGPSRSGGHFQIDVVEKSLAESLRRLRSDYLDLFLLHEPRPEDVTDELLSFLDKRRREGVVRTLGVASVYANSTAIARTHSAFFDVFQYSWSALDRGLSPPEGARFVITHRALLRAFEPLKIWFASNPAARTRLEAATQMDLSDEENLAGVLVGAALAANPKGIVLVASRQASRVVRNAQIMANADLVAAGRRFVEALAAEGVPPEPAEDIIAPFPQSFIQRSRRRPVPSRNP